MTGQMTPILLTKIYQNEFSERKKGGAKVVFGFTLAPEKKCGKNYVKQSWGYFGTDLKFFYAKF